MHPARAGLGRASTATAPQLFIADDAFGSTEYRPDAAERWARRPRPHPAARSTSTTGSSGRRGPAPLKRRRSAASTASTASSASRSRPRCRSTRRALDVEEKTLILFRHARAADLPRRARRRRPRLRRRRSSSHPHFTPERIRRFVARGCRSSRRPRGASLHAAIDARDPRADRRRWPTSYRRARAASTARCCVALARLAARARSAERELLATARAATRRERPAAGAGRPRSTG